MSTHTAARSIVALEKKLSIDLRQKNLPAAIGAVLNDGNGSDAGHVRVYEFLAPVVEIPTLGGFGQRFSDSCWL